MFTKKIAAVLLASLPVAFVCAQKQEMVRVTQDANAKKITVTIGDRPFTTFLYPDTLEKPVLFPIAAANETVITRGFPLATRSGDPTDHPHHLGLWFNFERVNGLDFWNNSYAIPKEKKNRYGWIKTDRILETGSGQKGTLSYHANWTNQANDILLEEVTHFYFSGDENKRIIDRITTLTADTTVLFEDAKDGMLGLRVAHELQIPSKEDEKYADDKGNITVVKGGNDTIANGNYLTSEGKTGNDAWSTRAKWCKLYGKMGNDSISVTIIDHPANINYPTFWHARGYGLFAANPLGENIFTNGKSAKNLKLQKGESVTFRYRIVIQNGNTTLSSQQINALADDFASEK
ncbi:MAG: PmoA family protein [Ilyomonas sp.]